MNTLLKILSGNLSYDSSWGIYAQRIEGKFSPESPARLGQQSFENGGLLDDCEFFASNQFVCDRRDSWFGSFSEWIMFTSEIDEWEAAFDRDNDEEWTDSVQRDPAKMNEVLTWVAKIHPAWYEAAYQAWENTKDNEEVADNLIDEINQASEG